MRVLCLLGLVSLLVGACTSGAAPSTVEIRPASTTTTTVEDEVTTQPVTTTSTQPPHEVGLYRVDPATLTPMPGNDALTTGTWNWVTGELSPNGEWLVLHGWVGDGTDRQLVQVIETATGDIVTEKSGGIGELVGVGDDGAVYATIHFQQQGSSLRNLAPGADGFKPVFSEFPSEFLVRGWYAMLDSSRAAWLGTFGGDFEDPVAGVVVADLVTGDAETHMLEGVTLGEVGETELGDWSVYETVQPAVVWDASDNRVLLVHGDEDKVTTLDLGSGETSTHFWSGSTSWIANLFGWLIPTAQAKGPSSYGVTRSAVLDPSGEWLYVATSTSEVIIEGEEEDWFIEHTPQRVEAIRTDTWEVVHAWDLPASEVTLSPDGKFLVAAGTIWTESVSSTHVKSKEVFVIDAERHELVGQFPAFDAWPEVQYSLDGRYMYIIAPHGPGHIDVVDLAVMEVIGTHRGTEWTKLFGGALLLADIAP